MRVHALFALILSCAVYAGLIGIDFGRHWDEPERIGTIIHAVERGELLPNWYNYPSAVPDLLILSAAPEIVRLSLVPAMTGKGEVDPGAFRRALQEHGFLLRARIILFFASMTGAVGIYGFMRRWRGSDFEALIAAGLYALSWEIGYHSRWIAPDVLTAACAAFVLWATHRAIATKGRNGSLVIAGAAAGLACGAKYPSGLLLLPVFVAAIHANRRGRVNALRALASVFVGFVAAYLLTTPGTLLQFREFWSAVRFELAHYQRGHGGGHTIAPGWHHLQAELAYLALVVLSRYAVLSALFFGVALLGAGWLIRREGWMAAAVLSFPIAYVAWMSSQRVMMARNLLVVVPFLAVLAARGIGVCRTWAQRFRWGSFSVSCAATVGLVINGIWLVFAGHSARGGGDPERELLAFLADTSQPCAMTPRLKAALETRSRDAGIAMPAGGAEAPQWAAFYASEVAAHLWTANRFGYSVRWFGPYEVNFDYYPSWIGHDRIVLMNRVDAAPLKLPLP